MRPTRPQSMLLEFLTRHAAEWAGERAWRLAPPDRPRVKTSLPVEGPTFHYEWEPDGSTVEVGFVDSGQIPCTPAPFASLTIEALDSSLRIHLPDHPPLSLSLDDASSRDPILRLFEATSLRPSDSSDEWPQGLTILTRSMQLLQRLHAEASRTTLRPAKNHRKETLADQLDDWLRSHLVGTKNIDAAAEHFRKSPRQLIRVLKETTGASFADHLHIHRLLRARSLLMGSDLPVQQVARQAGFNSREQFIRSFGKAFSWTPLQFRKAWKRASTTQENLIPLCQMQDRARVCWLTGRPATPPADPTPSTLVVANALHEIVELFEVGFDGEEQRGSLLESGGMHVVSRTPAGSQWLIRSASTAQHGSFTTPQDHSLAVVSPETCPSS